MKKRSVSFLCGVLAVILCIIGIFCGLIWLNRNYVIAGMHLYSRTEDPLDLRDQDISVRTYQTLRKKLPGTYIEWNVPFAGQTFPSDSREITVRNLPDEDFSALECMPDLKTVHAENCTDYARLYALQKACPRLDVLYQMDLGGQVYDQNTTAVQVPNLTQEQADKMVYLPKLASVDATGCTNYDLVFRIRDEHPEWNVTYTVPIGSNLISSDVTELTVAYAEYQELADGIPGLTNLASLTLQSPKASAEEVRKLQEQYPDVEIHCQVLFGNRLVDDDVEELDISDTPITSVEEVERAASYLPKLKKLILEAGTVDNEEIAQFRERQRANYKVVWTVYFTDKCKARTDETYFMPIKQGEYYFQNKHVYNLRYCEDMVCIDIGHAPVRDVEFLQFMPHLKYLILAHTEVQYIDPIVNCQELVYLEVDWSTIRSYEPLKELKKLEDLNLNHTACDMTPILEMNWLKHLWATNRPYDVQQALKEKLPNTFLHLQSGHPAGQGWRNLQNYYDMRDYLGMPYMD